jgi:hypothetical protein
MWIISYFSISSVPATGLTPTLDGYRVDNNSKVIDGESMTEIGGGFYKYYFSGIDRREDYVFIADGGVTLADTERYSIGSIAEKGGLDGKFFL